MRLRHSAISDGEAFKAFYVAERESLLRFFATRVYDPELALDLCAEVFAQAYIDRSRFRGSGSSEASAWLYSIGNGRLVDYYRKGTSERKALTRLRIELPAPHADELARVEELVDLDAARSLIRDGLAELSDEQRLALRLRIVEERPYQEVASGLGVSEQTARARVSRALAALSQAIQLDPAIKEMP
jgi:RNA polymerase sigma-70 factor (ECF subfamily)